MKCINCGKEISENDNFCFSCGHWTAIGYAGLKYNNVNQKDQKKYYHKSLLIILLLVEIVIYFAITTVKKDNTLAPLIYLEKDIYQFVYGYQTSLIKNDNSYFNVDVSSYDEAIDLIKEDFSTQDWKCYNNEDLIKLTYNLEEKYSIPSVTLCDLKISIAEEISDTIEKMYTLFPGIEGSLTNITITNALENTNYIAYFQPMYQFVNSNSSLNKVNKTQILINSYYFLNNKYLNNPVTDIVGENWYPSDATWTSSIAHELGHYISFKVLLKSYKIDNITYETSANSEVIAQVVDDVNTGRLSQEIVNEALNNYNQVTNNNYSLTQFAQTISNYAASTSSEGKLIYDEIIAEAIHDYYLHENNAQKTSLEIVSIIKERLS